MEDLTRFLLSSIGFILGIINTILLIGLTQKFFPWNLPVCIMINILIPVGVAALVDKHRDKKNKNNDKGDTI